MRPGSGMILTLALGVGACTAEVPLGSGDSELTGRGGSEALAAPGNAGGAGGSTPSITVTVGVPPAYEPNTRGCAHRVAPQEPVERWEGYLELADLPSGSDRVVLELTNPGPGLVEGRLTFGEGAFGYVTVPNGPPPQVGPTPPHEWPYFGASLVGDPEESRRVSALFEGFDYTLLASSVRTATRFELEATLAETWCEFCEQQDVYPSNVGDVVPTTYTCAPSHYTYAQNEEYVTFQSDAEHVEVWPWAHFTVCNSPRYRDVCECSADGCVSGFSVPDTEATIRLDLTVEGDVMTGLVFVDDALETGARLTRTMPAP